MVTRCLIVVSCSLVLSAALANPVSARPDVSARSSVTIVEGEQIPMLSRSSNDNLIAGMHRVATFSSVMLREVLCHDAEKVCPTKTPIIVRMVDFQ